MAATCTIRKVSWVVLVACFFLPFCRGGFLPTTPYKDAFDSVLECVCFGLPFLYPLLLIAGWRLFGAITGESPNAALFRVRMKAQGFFAWTQATSSSGFNL